ncbi:hypothetical protein EGK19_22040 [Enterobacter hormaechei]|nr:hypothetical protein YA46_18050 [Enterobacter hormaechei subsp. xiangfangensis]KTH74032.1 hypothetical protein ASV17_05735 [Enterobacter hormaechei subsp. xiangfangensis]RSA01142.1 hypothetical protein EGK19_22040 [Enterobacter hormaechei]RSA13722.1 hypothetical protein EGK25_22265 [Enterobacter hormaechei]
MREMLKKSPDIEIGAKHLDYGMMFSGQCENRYHYKGESCRFNGEIMEKMAMTRYSDVFTP